MTHQLTTMEAINRFVFAGNSTFTLRSYKTGTRFTYKVEASDDACCHFVTVLVGPDNSSNFKYLGRFVGPDFIHDRKERISKDAPSAKAFQFFSGCLRKGKMHVALEFYHEGKCGRCNRKLTTPASVLTGIGPECAEIMGIQQVEPPKAKEGQPSRLTLIMGGAEGKAKEEQRASSWNARLQEILDEASQKALEGISPEVTKGV